eukprot:7385832-Prymnesium_polylepis.1
MLRETDGTWDNGSTHFTRADSGSCGPQATWDIARRPAFNHGTRPRPARLAPRDAAHDRLRLTRHDGECVAS